MSCQSSVPPVMWTRKVGKVGKPIVFNIGLLCSKTFDDAIFEELFEAKYGLKKADIKKVNIKGVFQIWMQDGEYHEVPLKECHAWTREGCNHCPDFAAEHADISTGGIGKYNDWTLTIVRTELGREIIEPDDRRRARSRPGPATTTPAPSRSCTSCRARAASAGPRPPSSSRAGCPRSRPRSRRPTRRRRRRLAQR